MLSLAGKVAIVTGGGRGVGRAVALGFAERGADVVVVARNRDQLEAVAYEARALSGGKSLAVQADVTKEAEIEQMVERVYAKLGRADVLFNNVGGGLFLLAQYDPEIRALAGASTGPPFWEFRPDLWETVLRLDLLSVFLVSRAVTRRFFLRQQSGAIINNSARHAITPLPITGFSGYSTAKAGVNHLTRIMAVELKEHHVTVNAILFPLLKTAETEGTIFEQTKERRDGWYRPEVGVPLAAFLAGPDGAAVTGEILNCLEWNERNGFGGPEAWKAP
jgi:NAD(P)-dependent dehydrogenase (short-subunit alcohol dehydrogenase family)